MLIFQGLLTMRLEMQAKERTKKEKRKVMEKTES